VHESAQDIEHALRESDREVQLTKVEAKAWKDVDKTPDCNKLRKVNDLDQGCSIHRSQLTSRSQRYCEQIARYLHPGWFHSVQDIKVYLDIDKNVHS